MSFCGAVGVVSQNSILHVTIVSFRDLWCIVKCEVNIINFLLNVTVHQYFLVLVHIEY